MAVTCLAVELGEAVLLNNSVSPMISHQKLANIDAREGIGIGFAKAYLPHL
jgi:hypothetical protein